MNWLEIISTILAYLWGMYLFYMTCVENKLHPLVTTFIMVFWPLVAIYSIFWIIKEGRP